jgi:hypothetical protein
MKAEGAGAATTTDVSAYYYICVLILLWQGAGAATTTDVSAYYYICVLILLYVSHTTTYYVSSYYYAFVLILLYMCPTELADAGRELHLLQEGFVKALLSPY